MKVQFPSILPRILIVLLLVLLTIPAATFGAEDKQAASDDWSLVTFNFRDADIEEVIRFISALSGKSFIFDDKIKAKVTVISEAKLTKDEAFKVFESVLDVHGLTAVPSGQVIKIVQARDAVGKSLELVTEGGRFRVSDSIITRLVSVDHLSASDVKKIIDPLKSKAGQIDVYEPTNTIIITESASNIDRFMKIIKELDIPGFETVIEVIPLQFASAEILAQELDQILQAQDTPSTSSRTNRRTPPSRRGRDSKTTSRSSTASSPSAQPQTRIIPDDRTNSLIVLATYDQLKMIKQLITKLDYDTPRAYGKINVVYLEYADAEEMAPILSSLISGTGGYSRQRTQTARRGSQPQGAGVQQSSRQAVAGGMAGGSRGTLESFESEVSITADPATNSLVIVASPRDFQTIKHVINKLDIRRKQVYVEAVIMEVSPGWLQELGVELRGGIPLQDGDNVDQFMIGGSEFGLGTNDLLNNLTGALSGGEGADLASLSNPLALASSGFTAGAIFDTITIPGTGVTLPANVLLMRAIQSDTETNILSTPHLIAMDNEESEIVIGKNVPFITGSSQSQVSTITSVSREDVGIKLKFTPQISEGDYIKLTLYQEISALASSPLGMDVNTVGPTTTERAATTTVMVKDGQTIVIGGLMQDIVNNTENKVPFLGDIPILGWLFRYNSNNLDKTNLMIFLRPQIIKEDRDVDALAQEYKEKYEAYKSRAINVQNESDWTKFFDSKTDGTEEEAPPEEGNTSNKDAEVEEPEEWEFPPD